MTHADELAFTYENYRSLLRELLAEGYSFIDYESAGKPDSILLRHDVDLSVARSEYTAELEADLGIESTYFVQITSPLYNVFHGECREAIERIRDLGHDIGLHFNTHEYWREQPDEESLIEAVTREQAVLKQHLGAVVDTVSFHVPPEWVLRRSFEPFTSTYEERFFTEIEYWGDSSQRWREAPPDPKDAPEQLQILVHPGLWGDSDRDFSGRLEEVREHNRRKVDDVIQTQFVQGY